MEKNFRNETDVRNFLMNHVFYPSLITDSQYVFNNGYFARLKGDADQYATRQEMSSDRYDLKKPYAVVKQRDRYLLIDGSKAINGFDYAFQIEIEGDGKIQSDDEKNEEFWRYNLKLISEVSHQTMVSVYSKESIS